MAILKNILQEELGNSLKMIKRYKQALSALPKGSVVRKRVKNKEYDYLLMRENGKVVLKYKGQLAPAEKQRFEDAKNKRVKYRKLIADLRKQVHFLKRALHERKQRRPIRPRH